MKKKFYENKRMKELRREIERLEKIQNGLLYDAALHNGDNEYCANLYRHYLEVEEELEIPRAFYDIEAEIVKQDAKIIAGAVLTCGLYAVAVSGGSDADNNTIMSLISTKMKMKKIIIKTILTIRNMK